MKIKLYITDAIKSYEERPEERSISGVLIHSPQKSSSHRQDEAHTNLRLAGAWGGTMGNVVRTECLTVSTRWSPYHCTTHSPPTWRGKNDGDHHKCSD